MKGRDLIYETHSKARFTRGEDFYSSLPSREDAGIDPTWNDRRLVFIGCMRFLAALAVVTALGVAAILVIPR